MHIISFIWIYLKTFERRSINRIIRFLLLQINEFQIIKISGDYLKSNSTLWLLINEYNLRWIGKISAYLM